MEKNALEKNIIGEMIPLHVREALNNYSYTMDGSIDGVIGSPVEEGQDAIITITRDRINETIDDADFKDLSRHRSAVIQIALGSGKHTIKRKTVRKYETIGDKAVKAPLPKYVAKEIRQLGGTIKGGSFDVNKKEEEEAAEGKRAKEERNRGR